MSKQLLKQFIYIYYTRRRSLIKKKDLEGCKCFVIALPLPYYVTKRTRVYKTYV